MNKNVLYEVEDNWSKFIYDRDFTYFITEKKFLLCYYTSIFTGNSNVETKALSKIILTSIFIKCKFNKTMRKSL